MPQEDISIIHLNVIDSHEDVTENSATVHMENTRKSTKRTLGEYVKKIRHSLMVTEAEETPRGQWSQWT